jgi:hypothetical protein
LVEIESIDADRLDVRATRLEDGQWALQPTKSVVTTIEGSGKTDEGKPLRWSVGSLTCRSCMLAIADHTMKPAVETGMRSFDMKTGAFSSYWTRRTSFEMKADMQQGGSMQLAGDVQPEPLSLRARIGLREWTCVDPAYVDPYQPDLGHEDRCRGRPSSRGRGGGHDGPLSERIGLCQWRTLDRSADRFPALEALAFDSESRLARRRLQLDLGRSGWQFLRAADHPA